MNTDALAGVRAVIFDMDGLLLDSETLSMAALMQAGRDVGVPMPEPFCRSLIGSPLDRCRIVIRDRYGDDFPMDRFLARHAARLDEFVAAGRLMLKTGVPELLDLLDRRNWKRAIATSSGRTRTLHHLEAVGIAHRFHGIVTRDEVSRGKPDPEPFLAAAAILDIPPAACLALEDSHNGVRAAHAAGMPVIMVPDLLPPDDDMRARTLRIVSSLHDVVRLLENTGTAAAP